jgi:hypothetical protein
MVRLIPFSFPGPDSESILYIDLKAGESYLGGPGTQSLESSAPYFGLDLGGAIGLSRLLQLGISIGYQHCEFDNITYDTQSGAGTLSYNGSNVSLNTTCFFVQIGLILNL